MRVGIISYLYTKRTALDNYAYNLIENLINIGKTHNLYLITKIYNSGFSSNIFRILTKIVDIIRLPYIIKRFDVDVLHFPSHLWNQLLPFFFNKEVKKF